MLFGDADITAGRAPRSGMLLAARAGSKWVHAVAPTALRLVFQNLLQEQDDAVREGSQALWSTLLQRLGAADIVNVLPADTLEVLPWSGMRINSANMLTRPPQISYHHVRRMQCRTAMVRLRCT